MRPALPKSPRVLVTGGSGFIGTNLLAALTSSGIVCAGFDLLPPRDSSQEPIWVEGDVRDNAACRAVLADLEPTHVIHLGARTDMEGWSLDDYSSNTTGVECLVAALGESAPPPRCIYASTRLVTPVGYVPQGPLDVRPDSWYGRSKVVGEQLVRARARGSWTIVRPTSIWGPWFGVPYRNFFDNVRRRTYVHPRGHRVLKTFGYVDNTVDQIIRIAFDESGTSEGETIYLGDPPIEVGALADAVADASGVRRPPRVPLTVLRAVARIGDAGDRIGVFGQAPLTSRRLSNLTTDMVFDLTGLEAVAGTPAVPVEDGVSHTVAWLDREQAG